MTEEKNELVDAFKSYEWIILHTNPLHNEIDLSFTIEPVPSYIRKDVDLHKQKEWLFDKNKTPRDILFHLSINSLLSELVKKGIPLYKVDNKEITCVADIKRLWQETELDKNYYSFITNLSYTYKVLQARLTSQRLKIEKELMPNCKEQETSEALQYTEKDKFHAFLKKIKKNYKNSSLKWDDLEMTIIGYEKVKLKVKSETITTDYKKIGFEDKRKGTPDNAWKRLTEFAYNKGMLTKFSSTEKSKIEKDVQEIRNTLSGHFEINGKPIPDYKKEEGYETAFKISYQEEQEQKSKELSNFEDNKDDIDS